MELELGGRRAIVTGGSSGIGLAVAHSLAREGADVVLAAREAQRLEAARLAVAAHGTRVLGIPTDTTDDESVDALVAATVAGLGGVDIVVNCAAKPATPGQSNALADLDDDEFRRDIETKVLGYVRTARAAAPHMVAQGWGRIVNIAGLNVRRTNSPYASARNAAVSALTKNLADELGPAGITVTVVHPGHTVTERTPGLLARIAEERGISLEEAEAGLGAGTSIRRLVTAEEIGDIVAFLCSPRSAAITGDAIAVGGGQPGAIFY